LLPRQKKDQDRNAANVQDKDAERKAEQEALEEQVERSPSFQDMLSTVWQASAAVVEVVLGREPGPSSAAQRSADGPSSARPSGVAVLEPGGQVGSATTLGAGSAAANDGPEADPLPGLRAQQEPVAYTEQGTSSWLPLETGSLISRRV
jgi:hypothetical protein